MADLKQAKLRLKWSTTISKAAGNLSAKPVGATVTSQPLILKDEQSGLLTRTATTESVSMRADEKLTAFLEEPCAVVFNRAQKVTALDERAALA
jgi:hypothetical protein